MKMMKRMMKRKKKRRGNPFRAFASGGGPRPAPDSTPTFLGSGTRTTDEVPANLGRGNPGDLEFEALPAEISLHHFIGPYRSERTGRPPPPPVGGYGTDEYAPGFIGGVKFPTWNITPGNKVFDLGDKIPHDWIPYRGRAADETRVEGEPGDVWSNNFDPHAAGLNTPQDLEAEGRLLMARHDAENGLTSPFINPLMPMVPMRRGGRFQRRGR